MDSIERGLKKGKGSEQEVSAKLLVLLCLQLGSVSDCQEIYKEQKHILLTLMTDRSVSAAARAQVSFINGSLSTFVSKVLFIAEI